MDQFEVRKGMSRGGYFIVHHEWIDVYIPVIGTEPYLIWSVLSRYVNNDPSNPMYGTSYPSRDKVCRALKMRNQTFTDSIKVLQALGLIDVTKGTRGQNIYTIHEPPSRDQAEKDIAEWQNGQEVSLEDTVDEAVPNGTTSQMFRDGTGSGSEVERVSVPRGNPKKIKEKDKEKEIKNTIRESNVGSYTKVANEDSQPRSTWGRVSEDVPLDEPQPRRNSSDSQGGLDSDKSDKEKPVVAWKSPDLVRHFIRMWEETYQKKHPRINWQVQGRHMKQFLLDVYGPEKSKAIIDEFFKRRAEFESREYPNIGLHGLRQEWIVRKLLGTANMKPETKKKVTLRLAEFRSYQEFLGEDIIPDMEAYARNKGYPPEEYEIEWVD